MSVFTPVSRQQLEEFLENYNCGELVDFSGISAGIENTNFFVTTTTNRYVLTIFESLSQDELPYFLDLMAYIAERGLPSAHPVADRKGDYLRSLMAKPAALVQCLCGASIEQPEVRHCQSVGEMLGRLHVIGQLFPHSRNNDRGIEWRDEMRIKLHGLMSAEDQILLDDELAFLREHQRNDLPRGVIHADLFRDNVLFELDKLSGVIDFYYACNDDLLYDLAVTVNDWCVHQDGSLDQDRVLALLKAYHAQRPLLAIERAMWPIYLRAAALRFWLSRLHDTHFQREGEMTHTKNPQAFRRVLCHRREHQDAILQFWDAV